MGTVQEDRRRMEIILGQSQKQALDSILHIHNEVHITLLEKEYKACTRLFFRMNRELSDELLDNAAVQVKATGDKEERLKISDKQKECPNCKKPIPKTWKNHFECGWKE